VTDDQAALLATCAAQMEALATSLKNLTVSLTVDEPTIGVVEPPVNTGLYL
jgi:ABC-type branched-subunit amino acid transport system ATPase component